MGPVAPAKQGDRERKLNTVLAFALSLSDRLNASHDKLLLADIQNQIHILPLRSSSVVSARQGDLEKLGTELWNLATRLRRDESADSDKSKDDITNRHKTLCRARCYSFLLLDSARCRMSKSEQYKDCVRLIKVALKAAKICIEGGELDSATRVLERAAEYQDILSKKSDGRPEEEVALADRLRAEYFVVRTTLSWRDNRMDMAEHMFKQWEGLKSAFRDGGIESVGDLLYEIGRDALIKNNYELAIKWLERAFDALGEQDMDLLSSEAGELRLSIMQSIVQSQISLRTPAGHERAADMVNLIESDYGDKMVFFLLKIELLSTAQAFDSDAFCDVLTRMIRVVVLNDINFKTIMRHIQMLKDHSFSKACKALDELIHFRLFQHENQQWVEKAVVTRVWLSTKDPSGENPLEELQELFDTVVQRSKATFAAPATHASQTLLWKKVEAASHQDQTGVAESWCNISLHPLFEKAGAQNKARLARKLIQCALLRQNYASARDSYSKMPETGREEPMTRYLMYKVAIKSGDNGFADECLDAICRHSSKDATLLYACVLETQNTGSNKRQTIRALERVLSTYNYSAPAGIHLPALLRCTLRLLQNELFKNGVLDVEILNQLCKVFEGACNQVKVSRQKSNTPNQHHGFTAKDLEWFAKNAYNLSLQHCSEISPEFLVRLLNICIQFIEFLKSEETSEAEGGLSLRRVFCEFLAACTYITLARAEDHTETYRQHYADARKHCQEFRRAAVEAVDKLSGSSQDDIISKHLQIVKLELEAVLKLEKWDELEELFQQCWKYKTPDRYETLADLVLVIHSCLVKVNAGTSYQNKTLSILQKIINLTWQQSGNDVTKLARWIRCLFNLSISYDEETSLKCIEQAIYIASEKRGKPDKYPPTELEWLATSTFNRAVDYYMQESDAKCKKWAEQSFILAQQLEDDGLVRKLLLEKYSTLQFDK